MLRVAIYARISSDDGTALGVGRQVEDCLMRIETDGLELVHEPYVDNDVSATSGQRRPQFEALIGSVKRHELDAVVCYSSDRFVRRFTEWADVIELFGGTRTSILCCQSPDLQMDTANGRMVAGVLASMAAGETSRLSERVVREKLARALAGKPNGSMRSYGYNPDGSINPVEGQIVREMADRVLAGESIRSIVQDLERREVPTTRGGTWRGPTVRVMLMSAKISGQREHTPKPSKFAPLGTQKRSNGMGHIVSNGTWEGIITPAETARIREILGDPARRTQRSGRFLLTGILTCGSCMKPMNSHSDKRDGRKYQCIKIPGTGKCGRRSISAEPSDAFIRDVVLSAIYQGGDPRRFAQPIVVSTDAYDARRVVLDQERKAVAARYGAGEIDDDTFDTENGRIKDAIRRLEIRNTLTAPTALLSSLPASRSAARVQWDDWHVDKQRSVVRATIDELLLLPRRSIGVNRYDSTRLQISWQRGL